MKCLFKYSAVKFKQTYFIVLIDRKHSNRSTKQRRNHIDRDSPILCTQVKLLVDQIDSTDIHTPFGFN